MVTAIRSVASNVILTGSPSWSTRLNGAVTDPIARRNIAYVHHLYPNPGPATAGRWVAPAQAVRLLLRQYLDVRSQIGWRGWIFDIFGRR